MRFRLMLLASAVVVVAATVAASGIASGSAAKPIILGAQIDITGAAGQISGVGAQQGLLMAVDQINAHGGINGHKLQIVVEDSATTPDGGVLAARKLIQDDHAQLIISGASSTSTIAAATVAAQLHTVLLASFAGDPRVVYPFSKYIYRGAAANVAVSAHQMVDQALARKAKNVAVMTDTTLAYAVSEKRLFLDDADKAGVHIATAQTWSQTDNDFTSQVQAVKSAKADFIIIMGYPPATSKFLIQMRNAGVTAPVLGDQSLPTPELLSLAGSAADGMQTLHIGTQVPTDHTGAMGKFYAAFIKKYPTADTTKWPIDQDAWIYADTFVLADAIRRAGPNFTSDSLSAALDKTNGFVAGAAKNPIWSYAFPVGQPRSYNNHDHEGNRKLSLVQAEGGKWVLVPPVVKKK